ncbi:MAG TPA: protein kinase [Polyangiales bacterium]|nr:protein kinase [Polyangiales bacterium]
MQTAPIPDDEDTRLALLHACRIMYTPAEQAFDDVARLAADLCGTEIALITLVGEDRQWFKARVGVEQTEIARDLSFCGHCINHTRPLIVRDTLLDPRFLDNPLVTGDPHLRFYAGVPLQVEPGSAVGALSVADRTPRELSLRQLDSLRRLADQIARELRLRRDLARGSGPNLRSRLALPAGTVLGGRWMLEAEIGRGSCGAVYRAHDAHGQRVAIKIMTLEWWEHEHVLDRFVREARVLMHLRTPHVAQLIDVGNLDPGEGDLPYLVLEYLEGEDLGGVLARYGRLPYRQAFEWCADTCDGVSAAHRVGVVHRDLKPANIFLARTTDAQTRVKVLDFGIAAGEPSKRTEQSLTHAGALLGTPGYMSPEQIVSSNDVDARSDVWSMGVTLYELITGNMPFPGTSQLEMIANALTRPPLPLAAHLYAPLQPAVQDVLFTCLRRPREERFQGMAALASALRTVARA